MSTVIDPAPVSSAAPTFPDCATGACGHVGHPLEPREDDPVRVAERRVREALEELRSAIRALPVDHPVHQLNVDEQMAPWRLRAHATLWRIDRERRAWRRLHRVIRRWES